MFYDMYMGEVGMTNSCSYVDNFRTSKGIWLKVPFSNFFLIDFSLFEVGISSQDVCHKLIVCIFMLLFMSWYRRVVVVENEVEVIVSFARISAFSFPRMPVCEGTHMNSITLWVEMMMLGMW